MRTDVEGRSSFDGLLFLSGIWAEGDWGHHDMRHGPVLLLPACFLLCLIYQSNYTITFLLSGFTLPNVIPQH